MTDHRDDVGTSAEVRLVESSDGWLLTVTPAGLAILLAGEQDGAEEGHTEITVEVRPNLVPGDPFVATVQIAELTPERA
ncbi:MAG TPA: hypothetical protein VGN35_01820 [Jatrophihabitantaceae bacterium]|nr:hypothetical protein [Jatrophihabitantaceae bacterium]